MKVIPIQLATQIEAGTAQLCQCLRMERRDGTIIRLTSAERDIVVPAGVLNEYGESMTGRYLSSPGITPTDISQSAGLAVDNLGIQFGKDDTFINELDILQGLWDKTAFRLFSCSVPNPEYGVETLMKGYLGEYEIKRDQITYELRGVLQMLQQPITRYLSKTCVVRFGSQGDGMCNVDIGLYTHTGTVTSVTNRRVFTDTARLEAANYFKGGIVTFTSGDLAGVSLQVSSFLAGVFTFAVQPFRSAAPGDTYTAIAGCDHTRDACKSFNNIYNMQAAPDIPGTDYLSSPP